MAGTMTNEEIMSEFENLFGGDKPDEEEAPVEETENEEPSSEEPVEKADETEKSDEEGNTTKEEKPVEDSQPPAEDKKQSKQNYAFAEQRLQIKKNEQFIRSLGKLIGFDDSASVSEIQDKVKEVLLEKEARDNNIPIELAKRLDRAEELIQENDRIKLEKKVQEDFSELIDKHNLDEGAVNEFTQYLIDNDKNPMTGKAVDLEAEYLKLHFQDMIDSAVADALAKEESRKKKVEEKAASGVPKGAGDKGESKISSVKELDDLFANMDL